MKNRIVVTMDFSYQDKHINRAAEILGKYHIFRDCSKPGNGKTDSTAKLAVKLGMGMVIICPASAVPHWKEVTNRHGATIEFISSYDLLKARSKDRNKNKHGILRYDNIEDKYETTEAWTKMVTKGVMVVLDEYQMCKNPLTHNSKACCALTREIDGTPSKLILVSGTPFAKKEFTVSNLMLMGIIKHKELFNYNSSSFTYDYLGLRDLTEYCQKVGLDISTHFPDCNPHAVSHRNVLDICYDIFTKLIVPNVTSCAIRPQNERTDSIIENRFYDVSVEKKDQIKHAEIELKRNYAMFGDMSSDVYKSLSSKYERIVNRCKVECIVQDVKTIIEKDPNAKIIIHSRFLESHKIIQGLLSEELASKCIEFNGHTEPTGRKEIIDRFKEDSDEIKIIVSNPSVGGTIYSMDDIHGGRERYMFLIPSDHFLTDIQALERTSRATTKSQSKVIIAWLNDVFHDEKLRQNTQKKFCTLVEVIGQNTNLTYSKLAPGKSCTNTTSSFKFNPKTSNSHGRSRKNRAKFILQPKSHM